MPLGFNSLPPPTTSNPTPHSVSSKLVSSGRATKCVLWWPYSPGEQLCTTAQGFGQGQQPTSLGATPCATSTLLGCSSSPSFSWLLSPSVLGWVSSSEHEQDHSCPAVPGAVSAPYWRLGRGRSLTPLSRTVSTIWSWGWGQTLVACLPLLVRSHSPTAGEGSLVLSAAPAEQNSVQPHRAWAVWMWRGSGLTCHRLLVFLLRFRFSWVNVSPSAVFSKKYFSPAMAVKLGGRSVH